MPNGGLKSFFRFLTGVAEEVCQDARDTGRIRR